jgi:chromosome segregation ATPase
MSFASSLPATVVAVRESRTGTTETVEERKMKSFVTTAILTGVVAMGCQNSAERKVDQLAEAQQNANIKADDARREADIKSAKAYDEANEKIREEREKVGEKTADVEKSLTQARAELKKDMEEKLGKLDKRLIDLHTKIATKTTTKVPRTDLEQNLQSIKDQTASLRSNVPSIDATGAASLSATKDNFEARVSQIEKSLDDLENKV